jgi:hypothetical protein
MIKAGYVGSNNRAGNLYSKTTLSTKGRGGQRVIRVDVFVMAGLLLAGAFLLVAAGPKEQKEKSSVTAELKLQATGPMTGGAIDKTCIDYNGKEFTSAAAAVLMQRAGPDMFHQV